jgi:hypothetical protein
MPTLVTEASLSFSVEALEAIPPTHASYPSPALRRTGKKDEREFRTLVISNPYLELTMLPDLGGRIIRIRDKRTQLDLIPFHHELQIFDGGTRGVFCDSGLQIVLSWDDRNHSMGTVSTSIDFAGEDEEPNAIRWGEIGAGGVSLNLRISMPADTAKFELEVRAFNRTEQPILYNGGFRVGGWNGRWLSDSNCPTWISEGSGLVLETSIPFEGFSEPESSLSAHRFNRLRVLAPHQLDAWTVTVTPYTGLQSTKFVGTEIGFGWTRSDLCILSSRARPEAKVVIQTEAGKVMESVVALTPEVPEVMDLSGLDGEIVAAAVLASDRTELGRFDGALVALHSSQEPDEAIVNWFDPISSEIELAQTTFDISRRHLAHWKIALRQIARRELGAASASLEQCLLFNGEDHLAWWLKAVCERLWHGDGGERAEILNAHYLAPLDPVLRAESYLASPSRTVDKSPLLNPLEDIPESFVDVACLLLDAQLWEEATHWIDEALRHVDLPMLHYLQAFSFLEASRMDVQAAGHVTSAARLQAKPPYPWRPIERLALEVLGERFPADVVLAEFVQMARKP